MPTARVSFTVQFTPAEHDALRRAAALVGMTPHAIAREAIADAVDAILAAQPTAKGARP